MFRRLTALRVALRSVFWRGRVQEELDEEMRYHMEREIEAGLEAGLTHQEARYAALRSMGAIDKNKEECRDVRGMRWMEDLLQDCRYGLRGLRKTPVFATIAIFSLALGIGANTAIFSLIDQISFRPLPVREPERLVEIGPCCLSYPLFENLRQNSSSLAGLFGYAPLGTLDILIDGRPEIARIDLASGSFYSVLGVPAIVGRTFGEEVDRAAGVSPVAVISHRYWRQRFGSDPAVIGKTFRRLNTVFTIIGVTPPEFFGVTVGQEFDITVPIKLDAQVRGGETWQNSDETWWIGLIGRLRSGTAFTQARAEIRSILSTTKFSPQGRPEEAWALRSGARGFDDLHQEIGSPLTILMGIVALVLLLACANIANLLLTRSAARQHEIAVRLAIGAGRGRIVRQLLTEGLLLALGGGVTGLLLAYIFAERLVTLISNYGPRVPLNVVPDARILLFSAAACFAACTLFSVAPALLATRQSFQTALSEIRAARWRLGKSLIVAQMAISVLLLITAGLFGRTLMNLYAQNPGFDENGVVLFSTNAQGLQYSPQQLHELQSVLTTELKALPGTEAASLAAIPPVNRGSWGHGFLVEGGDDHNIQASLANTIGPDFFRTLRSPLIAGREFNERDTAASPGVAIINEAFARYYFQDRSPLGRWLAIRNTPEQRYEIVGVVQGYKYLSLRRDTDWRARTVYLAAAQAPTGAPEANTYFLRTNADTATAARQIEAVVKRFDTALRSVDLITLENHVARSVLRERMLTILAVFFGAVALLLAAIGIYGVMAFQVARRRREIAIRIALGAEAARVVRMILTQVARLTILGCVIGAAGGLALTRVAKSVLYDVQPNDPATFVTAMTIVVAVGLAAAYLPGRWAARTNPVETLKVE